MPVVDAVDNMDGGGVEGNGGTPDAFDSSLSSWNFFTSAFTLRVVSAGVLRITFGVVGASGNMQIVAVVTAVGVDPFVGLRIFSMQLRT